MTDETNEPLDDADAPDRSDVAEGDGSEEADVPVANTDYAPSREEDVP